MKEAKILIGILPLLYVAIACGLWLQEFKLLSGVMMAFSFLFGLLVIGIIVNSERK